MIAVMVDRRQPLQAVDSKFRDWVWFFYFGFLHLERVMRLNAVRGLIDGSQMEFVMQSWLALARAADGKGDNES